MIPESLVAHLRLLAVVLTIFLCVGIASSALQLAHTAKVIADTPSGHTVTLTGTGEVDLIPTKATVDISVFKEGEDKTKVGEEGNTTMTAVQKAIVAAGVVEDDIQTSTYQLNPSYDYSVAGVQKITGYQMTQSVTVTVRDVDTVSTIIDAATAAGANSVSTPRFEVEDQATTDAAKDEARSLALTRIDAQKASYEANLGVRLGKIVSVTESALGDGPYPTYLALGAADSIKSAEAPIATGTNTVGVNLSVTYSIK